MQIENFLSTHPDFAIRHASGVLPECINKQGALRTTPAHFSDIGGMDGFYAMVLKRK
jgi:hypothetical protein